MKTSLRILSAALCAAILTFPTAAASQSSDPVKIYVPSKYSQVYERIKDYIQWKIEPYEDLVWMDEYEAMPALSAPAETMVAAEEPVAEAEIQTSRAALDPDFDGTNVQVEGID